MSATLLLVEDNPHVMGVNREALTMLGYRVLEAETIKAGKTILENERPDLIVLDIMLPDGDGRLLCEELRGDSGIPILFLTALAKEDEIIEGFRVGGDDYLPKTYGVGVLIARIEALLKRAKRVPESITKGALTIIIPSNEILVNGENMNTEEKQSLTQKEFSLLLHFVQHENRLMGGVYLYETIWGQQMGSDTNAFRNTIHKLRKKLTGSGYTIAFERGEGYCFEKE